MTKIRKRESGRSMIEIVGVLAISGLLTAGAFVLVQSGMASQKRNRAADEINTLAQNARLMYSDRDGWCNHLTWYGDIDRHKNGTDIGGYTGHKTAMAMLKNSAETPFGESTYYAVTQSNGNNGCFGGFVVWIVGISTEDCEPMAVRAYSNATAQCTTVNGKKVLQIKYTK